MERLSDDAIYILHELAAEGFIEPGDYVPLSNALFKLKKYEDLEEQERLVKLPCKVGDVLWTYANYPAKYVYPFEVRGLDFMEQEITTDKVGTVKWYNIGKTVFLTREEAEKALEGAEAE